MALVIDLSRSAMTAKLERLHLEEELRSGIHRGEFLRVLHGSSVLTPFRPG